MYFGSGGLRVLTAGHCFAVGATTYNANQNNFSDRSNPIGYVDSSDFDQSLPQPVDVEVIGAAPNTSLWRGGAGAAYSAFIVGRMTSIVGEHVCADGGYGGEICSNALTITAVNQCVVLNGGTSGPQTGCHTVTAVNTAGAPLTQGGDSGGPWFRLSNGNVYAVGIHRGLTAFNDTEYYTDITNILSDYNAHLCYLASCPPNG